VWCPPLIQPVCPRATPAWRAGDMSRGCSAIDKTNGRPSRDAHWILIAQGLAVGLGPRLALAPRPNSRFRGTDRPTAGVDTTPRATRGRIAIGLATGAERSVAAERHEPTARAPAPVELLPALVVRVAATRCQERTCRTGLASVTRGAPAGVRRERRRLDAGQDGGRPRNGCASPDPLEHPPTGDAAGNFERLLWTHRFTPPLDPNSQFLGEPAPVGGIHASSMGRNLRAGATVGSLRCRTGASVADLVRDPRLRERRLVPTGRSWLLALGNGAFADHTAEYRSARSRSARTSIREGLDRNRVALRGTAACRRRTPRTTCTHTCSRCPATTASTGSWSCCDKT
jgi:hypothetical protein